MKHLLNLLVYLAALQHVEGRALGPPDTAERDAQEDESLTSDVVTYLSSYGYLPKSDNHQTSHTAVESALTRLQDFAGIETTGKMDAATRKLLSTKRCGLPDIPPTPDESHPGPHRHRHKRYVINGAKWPNTTVSWRLASWTSRLGEGKVLRVLHDALQIWAKASALEFVRVGQEPSDIEVQFASGEHGDGYPFDGPDVVLAHAFYPGLGMGGNIHFDDSEEWTDNNELTAYSREVNLLSVAAHEFGHSLGLGHSRELGALMYPYYQYGYINPNNLLHYDDVVAIQSIYGRGAAPTPTPPPVVESTTPTTTIGTTGKPTTEFDYPNVCGSPIDGLSRIRNEIMVFKNRWFWRFDQHGFLLEEPADIGRFWNGLPRDLPKIDAVYERPNSDTIVFFSGRQYWEFEATHLKPGFPRSISELGLPDSLESVDAIFVWEYNDATYILAGDDYWKFDEVDQKVELSYPRKLRLWKDLPSNIGAAFTNRTIFSHYHREREVDTTFFFKGDQVYKFSTFFMRVEKDYPIHISDFWAHCKKAKLLGEFTGSSALQLRISHGVMMIMCIISVLRLLW